MIDDVKRKFIPGEEWLYYKIYCGTETADTILLTIIQPFIKKLLDKNIVNKWFFIRYSDPENHLRVRLLLKDISCLGYVMIKFNEIICPLIQSKQIWNIKIDTYNREIERYGKNTIEMVETFFYYDSESIINIIKTTKDDKKKLLKTIQYLEEVILLFNLTKNETLCFFNEMNFSFKKEFNIDKNGRKELSKRYNELKKIGLNIRVNKNHDKEIADWFLILKNHSSKLDVSKKKLLSNLIHMTINRVFSNQQRFYEMVFYSFYLKKYKSEVIRNELD